MTDANTVGRCQHNDSINVTTAFVLIFGYSHFEPFRCQLGIVLPVIDERYNVLRLRVISAAVF